LASLESDSDLKDLSERVAQLQAKYNGNEWNFRY